MKKAYRKAKDMVFGEGDIRIMSVGPSGVGKSTIGNQLMALKSKDTNYLKAEPTALSCTQEPTTVTTGTITYTDVPGIPDTNPNKTKTFYNMVINEAKDPCTAIFFVFSVDMRMDPPTKNRIRQCGLLFKEINNCSAAKILILNDMRAWNNLNGLDEDDEEYEEEKALHDKVRQNVQLQYQKDIVEATGIDFYCSKIIYGLNKKINPDTNMKVVMKFLKLTLQSFPCVASPHLRTFEELEKVVKDAKQDQDYEKRLINEQEAIISGIEYAIQNLKITIASAGATATAAASAAGVAAFFTFGTSLVVGSSVAAAAAATAGGAAIALALKEKELSAAQAKIDKKNLEAAVKEYEAQCEMFEELKKGLSADEE